MAFDLEFEEDKPDTTEQIEAFVDAETEENHDFFKEFDAAVTDFESIPQEKPQEAQSFFAPTAAFKSMNQTSVEVIVGLGDTAIAWAMSDLVSKSGNIEKYKASKEERKELSEALYRVMPDNKPIMSPKMQLIAVIVKIYGAKVNSAMKDRKIAELQADLAEKEKIIKDLEFKAKMRRTRNSMVRDQAKTDEYLESKKNKAKIITLNADGDTDVHDTGTPEE